MARFTALQSLRAYLAWWVLFSHALHMAGLFNGYEPANPVARFFLWNFPDNQYAVTVFMIVSGFVVAHLLLEKQEHYTVYIVRRAFRLFPVYLVVLAITVAGYSLIDLASSSLPATREQWLPYQGYEQTFFWPYLVSHLTMLHGIVPDSILPGTSLAFLPPAWSISLEWQYYLVAPLLILLLVRGGVRSMLIATFAVASLYALFQTGLAGTWWVRSVLPLGLPSFTLGIISRHLLNVSVQRRPPYEYFAAVLLLLPAIGFLPSAIWLATMCLLLVEMGHLRVESRFMASFLKLSFYNRPILAIGEWSYSTYLLHLPLFSIAVGIYIRYFGGSDLSRTAMVPLIGGCALLTLPLSWLLFRTIEKPGIKLGHRTAHLIESVRMPSWALAAVAAGMMLALLSLWQISNLSKMGLKDYAWNLFDNTVYARAVIAPDYFSYGFIRRGLGGTIATVFTAHPVAQLLLFILISALMLVIPIAILLIRLRDRIPPLAFIYIAIILLLSPQTFLSWGQDLGRTDMLALGFTAWGTLAVLVERRWLGVAAVLVGLLVHETAFIFGGPLLVAFFWHDYRAGRISAKRAISLVAGLIGICGVITAVQFLMAPPPSVLASMIFHEINVVSGDQRLMWRDLAVYMAVGGKHALITAMCLSFDLNPNYSFTIFFCLSVLAAYVFMFNLWKETALALLAVFLPVAFMLVIANDTGRWLDMGVLSSWLLLVFLIDRGVGLVPDNMFRVATGLAMLCALLLMGITSFSDVNSFTRRITNIVGTNYSVTLEDWLNSCDPQWRKHLYGAKAS